MQVGLGIDQELAGQHDLVALAEALAAAVRALPAGRVNIIAHSMGGLDARYAISKLGLGNRVASTKVVYVRNGRFVDGDRIRVYVSNGGHRTTSSVYEMELITLDDE